MALHFYMSVCLLIGMGKAPAGTQSIHAMLYKDQVEYLDNEILKHRWASYNHALRNLVAADMEKHKKEE